MGIKALSGILFTIIVGLGIAWWQGWIVPSNETPAYENPNTSRPPETGIVKSIIDPITIELESGHIIRYIGVRAPSVSKQVECFGKETLLANESVIGKHVRLEEETLLARSSDGAWTRYVFLQPEVEGNDQAPMSNAQTNPNEQMIDEENTGEDIVPDLGELADVAREQVTDSALGVADRDQDEVASSPEASHSDAEEPNEIFINERILEGGFGFPVVSEDMVYGERMLSAARFASATGKGLWSQCEVDQEVQPLRTQNVDECVIKGKVTNAGEKLYRTPQCPGYQQTIPIQVAGGMWFCAEDIAADAGFTKAPDCP